MKYKVGDKVRIVSEKGGLGWNLTGKMDKWLGKTMTIRGVESFTYKMKEDFGEGLGGAGWSWTEGMIEGLAYKFNVGDKVRVRKDLKVGYKYHMADRHIFDGVVSDMMPYKGKIVTINEITGSGKYRIKGSDYNWTDEMFEDTAVCHEKIIITVDGSKTIARLFDGNTVIKTAKAKCSPEDEFDFETGAMLAMRQLFSDFKKDEWVRIIGKTRYDHNYDLDDVVKIDNIDKDGDLHCTRPYDKMHQIISPEDVKSLKK